MRPALGLLLVLAGAVGATTLTRRLEFAGRRRAALAAALPLGALIGAGAALVRGGQVIAAGAVGALLLPAVTALAWIVEARRRARSGPRPDRKATSA